jgi:UPF0755 protein
MPSAFSGFLSFLLLLAIGFMGGLVWGEHRMHGPGPLAADKVIYIAPGAEVPDIIAELDREGVIDSPFLLNIALLAEGRSKVKAGEHLFKQNISVQDVIDTLVSGKQVLHAITIPEGLTSEQIVERLREADVLVGDIADMPKEGSLLPETFKVSRGAVRADIIKKMQDDQKRVVDQIWAHRTSGLPLRSLYELITLASIVEKETGKADERPRVASVLLKRLKKGMRLQSDPTIVYGLTQGKGLLGRGITRSELEKLTPYNTYLIDGLPPGPIANPGRAALEAVANPSRTQDLYFVADGTGGHVFSETLDQHSRNVQRWRQIEKEAKDKLEQAAPDAAKTAPMSATAANAKGRAQRDGGKVSVYTFGPGLEELGISVRGDDSPAAMLDGPVNDEDRALGSSPSAALPAGPNGGTEQKSSAAGLGPAAIGNDALAEPERPQGEGRPERARVLDASEGTPLDPLGNKTYDLNYAKTVPAIK